MVWSGARRRARQGWNAAVTFALNARAGRLQ